MNYTEIKLLEDLNLGKHSIQYEEDCNDIALPLHGTDLRVKYDYRVFKNSFLRRHDDGTVNIIQRNDKGREVIIPLSNTHSFFQKRIWEKALSLKIEIIKP